MHPFSLDVIIFMVELGLEDAMLRLTAEQCWGI